MHESTEGVSVQPGVVLAAGPNKRIYKRSSIERVSSAPDHSPICVICNGVHYYGESAEIDGHAIVVVGGNNMPVQFRKFHLVTSGTVTIR
jgi:C1A family cysteine protease